MTQEIKQKERTSKPAIYFTIRELSIIFMLAILAALSGTFAPKDLHLGDGGLVPTLTHGILKLPGPGTGLMFFGGALCLFLVLGMLLVKKPWTAITISVIVIALDLLIGQETVSAIPMSFHSLDVIFILAIIIELLPLLSWEKPPLQYIVPAILACLGASALLLYVSGQDKIGYLIIAFIAFCYTIICYKYPMKYLLAGMIATMYYILHFWIFCGNSLAAGFPASPLLIPLILCAGAVGGALFTTAAYVIDILIRTYTGQGYGDAGAA